MRINAEIPWDIEIPWLDSQAAGGLGSLTAFAAQVADLAGGLPQAQPTVQSDPALVAGIEQKLERELTTLILSHFGPVRVLGEEHYGRPDRPRLTAPDRRLPLPSRSQNRTAGT